MWLAVLTVVAVTVAVLALAVVVVRRFMLVVSVQGNSMRPTLLPGDRVLGLRRRRDARLRRGDLVVCHLPVPSYEGVGRSGQLIVKRITAVAGDPLPGGDATDTIPPGHVWVRGDGAETYDSIQFGALPNSEVLARVVARLASPRP